MYEYDPLALIPDNDLREVATSNTTKEVPYARQRHEDMHISESNSLAHLPKIVHHCQP